MNKIAEIMKRERCSFTQAQKLAGLANCLVTKNRAPSGVVSNLQDGMELYDKWKNGPFTDTDGTERLEIWIWENLHQLFALIEFTIECENKAWANEHAAATANNQSPESPELHQLGLQ